MVPVPSSYKHSSRLLYTLLSVATQYVPNLLRVYRQTGSSDELHIVARPAKRDADDFDPHNPEQVVFAVLIPVLVLLSGLFAGLTLGYMSLDETQLNVLAISGTPKQREYANKIKPIRKNGHLLLVTLLLANMITNETLPVISDPVLGGGVQSVVVSTTLIVIFAEIIPQSIFTRHGLFLGAKMAGVTKILIYVLGVIAWPVAKLLEFVLGPHHGIIYRRAELKELIAMHSSMATHGGDLKTDTVTIIGATLDLQEKVVTQAMTPIKDVFMLSIDSKLDYDLLKKICMTGHSRVPVYDEIEVPMHSGPSTGFSIGESRGRPRTQKVKKIVGILLVKHCVLLDPNDAIPIRKIPLNKVPCVPQNEPLLGILDRFQEGRSHMAIVSRFSREKAASVKKVVKHSLTQRLRERVGMGDSSSDSSDEEEKSEKFNERKVRRGRRKAKDIEEGTEDGDATLRDATWSDEYPSRTVSRTNASITDNSGVTAINNADFVRRKGEKEAVNNEGSKSRRPSFQLPRAAIGVTSMSQLEQIMPADAVLAKEGAEEFLQGFDSAINPLGIITLEDVLEELIGEEIYDEFDPQGAHGDPYVPPAKARESSVMTEPTPANPKPPSLKPLSLKGFSFLRSRSAPPSPREATSSEKLSAPNTANDLSASPLPRTNSQSMLDTSDMQGEDRITRGPPSVIIEQHSPTSSPGSSPPEEPSPLRNFGSEGKAVKLVIPQPIATPVARTSSNVQVAAPVSRSASPAPSLEAFLLERKRRMGGAGAGAGAGVGAAVSSPSSTTNLAAPAPSVVVPLGGPITLRRGGSAKGTRFKSSPLVGGDRASVVVAEKVKEDMNDDNDKYGDEPRDVFVEDADVKGGNDEGRIPDGKDKEGPDKDSNSTKRSKFVI